MDYVKCTNSCNDSFITLLENDSKLVLKNQKRITVNKIKVDKCLIVDEKIKKCDFIIEFKASEKDVRSAYIELKGGKCKITDAIKQLESTIEKTRTKFLNHKKAAYVIGGQFPKNGATDRKLRDDFIKKNKIPFYDKPKIFEMQLTDLCK